MRETWTLRDLGRSEEGPSASPRGDLEEWEHRERARMLRFASPSDLLLSL